MAKVRVYELAKDLNMTNKQLLNKMKELKIKVKSHMSSLEDSDVTTIKRSMFGKKKQKNDVKVRPSVIRRRKAKAEPETAETPEAESAEPVSETPAPELEKTVAAEAAEKEEPVPEASETAAEPVPEKPAAVIRKKAAKRLPSLPKLSNPL